MDVTLVTNLALVMLFVLVGGVFAGTEMAIVSLRAGQVRQIAASGVRGQRIAALVNNPNTFLSAVQIGVTVAGFFSSAYGGATLAPVIAPVLQGWGVADRYAGTLALVVMTLAIAYLSLVFGELVPKRLAMQRAVGFTRALAPPLNLFATAVRPVIWLLSRSTDVVVRLLGGDPNVKNEEMSQEEIRDTVSTHEGLPSYHRQIFSDVFRAGEQRLTAVMRPRPDVVFLHGRQTIAEAVEEVVHHSHSRYPVLGDGIDDVLGFVHVRDLLAAPDHAAGQRLKDRVRTLTVLPGTNQVLTSLATLRRSQQHIALVVDEYGGTEGIVTMEDLVEEVVGEIYDEYDTTVDPEDSVLEQGGSLRLHASLALTELAHRTGVPLEAGGYDTVAGLVVDKLGRLGRVGDVVEADGLRFEVTAATRTRITGVQVSRAAADDGGQDPAER